MNGWSRPSPLGAPQATEQIHFVAAPLLAGAAVATTGVLGADGEQFRWPGPTMLFLTLSAITLIASIQLAFRARGYLYTPGELRDWWTDEAPPAEDLLREEQRADLALWRRWTDRAATAYNAGIVLLGCGMLGLLAPPEGVSALHTWSRWIAVGAAGLGTGWEVMAVVRGLRKRRRSRR